METEGPPPLVPRMEPSTDAQPADAQARPDGGAEPVEPPADRPYGAPLVPKC